MIARIALPLAALALALTACSGQGRPRGPRDIELSADPSAVVTAELAFARLAQEKGQWTAFAEYATDDAVMFVPEPVNAKQWLKKQANPAKAVVWQPYQVWSSCDGSLAATKGAWQRPDGSVGYFTTVWQRQRKLEYKWVMDQGDGLAEPLPVPDMVEAKAADCAAFDAPEPAGDPVEPSAVVQGGESIDGTLRWSVVVRPDMSRSVAVTMLSNGRFERVLDLRVAAPNGG